MFDSGSVTNTMLLSGGCHCIYCHCLDGEGWTLGGVAMVEPVVT